MKTQHSKLLSSVNLRCYNQNLSVSQTAVPLQFALFELARNPDVQERVRTQALSSWKQAAGDPQKALQGAPLLKGTVKETLRSDEKTHCDQMHEQDTAENTHFRPCVHLTSFLTRKSGQLKKHLQCCGYKLHPAMFKDSICARRQIRETGSIGSVTEVYHIFKTNRL